MGGYPVPTQAEDHTTSVWADIESAPRRPMFLWTRRIGTSLLALLVALGAVGLFGERMATTSTAVAGAQLSVTYPVVTRAGRDAPLVVRIERPGGFDGPVVELAFTTDYFEYFDYQRFYPEADSETADGRWVRLSFAAPPGEVFELRVDMNAEPRLQFGHQAQVALIVDGEVSQPLTFATSFIP